MKFKVGQMVRMVRGVNNAQEGDTGIIKGKSSKFDKDHLYAVEFPRFEAGRDGHDCDGLVPSDRGHWLPLLLLKLQLLLLRRTCKSVWLR